MIKRLRKKRPSINIKYQIMRKKNISVTYVMKSSMQQRDLSNIKGHVMKVENIHVITAVMRKQQMKILTHIVNRNISRPLTEPK